jgi:hypothetical protein
MRLSATWIFSVIQFDIMYLRSIHNIIWQLISRDVYKMYLNTFRAAHSKWKFLYVLSS